MNALEITLTGAVLVLAVGIAILAWNIVNLKKDLDNLWLRHTEMRLKVSTHSSYIDANEKWAKTITEVLEKTLKIVGEF